MYPSLNNKTDVITARINKIYTNDQNASIQLLAYLAEHPQERNSLTNLLGNEKVTNVNNLREVIGETEHRHTVDR